MNKEDQIFELLTKMYSELKSDIKDVKTDLQAEIKDVKVELKADIQAISNSVIRIEQNHGKKLEALFDRYKQNAEQLCRIEDEVKKHDEVILRRIK